MCGWPLRVPQLLEQRGAAARLLHRLPVGPGALAGAERDGVALGQPPQRLPGARCRRHTPITTTGHPTRHPVYRSWRSDVDGGGGRSCACDSNPRTTTSTPPTRIPTSTRAATTTSSTPTPGLGGWVRMGNRPNERYAEMTVCLYLPDGRVGFMFKRPDIEGHTAHDAGGLRFEVVAPYEEHRVTYDGKVCVLGNPRDMADPGQAFTQQPARAVRVDLRVTAVAQPFGGEPEWDEGEEPPPGRRTASRGATPSSRWRSPGPSAGRRAAVRRSTPGSACATTRGVRGSGRASGGTAGSPPASVARHRVHAPRRTRRRSAATSAATCSTSTATATHRWCRSATSS